MPTALSSTDPWRAVRDVGHLLWFRAVTGRRRVSRAVLSIVLALTTAIAVVPAFVERPEERTLHVLIVLPTALAAFLLLSVVSGLASGGGRELLPRDQGVAYPLSPTTDHLGALLLIPLNVAWLVQTWALLGATAYAVGPAGVFGAQVVVILWIVLASSAAQAIAWAGEGVRRVPGGHLVLRGLGVLAAATAGWLCFTDRLSAFLDGLDTRSLVVGAVSLGEGNTGHWVRTVAILLLAIPLLVAAGAVAAHLAARRHPRDELRIESETRTARKAPRSDLLALLRLDRASVWRVVPMRRGIMVLALGPGLVGVAGGLDWAQMTILPGLVASGGALLFGVNAWCLEGRGVLWRESLPVDPSVVFDARVVVLLEFLLVASGITVLLAALRAGVPNQGELAAILCTWLVVVLQVVSASMRWSAKRPFAVDLRSARATPAPPGIMVGYSARLAVSTTLTSLIFSGLARVPAWELSVLVALPFVAVSGVRVLRARAVWLDPEQRVRIVSAVAG